jgi:putative ABC transport system permease protein
MVAQTTGLRVGDTFNPYHGVIYDSAQKHKEQFTVVGILKQTNSPSDRVVWIPIDADFRIAGHVLRGAGMIYRPQPGVEIPDENKEVSAVMLKFRTPKSGFMLDQQINKQGKDLTLAWPIARVMADLFNKIGWVSRVLELVAYLVVVVAAGSILASIYNTMNERRREFAILRALGARRWTVSSAIVLEATTITLIGVLGGFLVYGIILAVVTEIIRVETGVVLNALQVSPPMIIAPLGMLLIGALAGLAPAIKAYGTDVASNLSPTS